jgi:hypothetical protein
MNDEIIFQERQRFRQWWLWALLLSVDALFLYGVYVQIIRGGHFGTNPGSDAGLLAATGMVLLVSVIMLNFRLDSQIRKDGICFRFFPFHWAFRFYPWDKLSKSFVRQYNPIGEYGGWGLRFGMFGKGRAYNVSGNKGIQLVLTDGKRILIGTGKPDEAKAALKKAGHLVEEG